MRARRGLWNGAARALPEREIPPRDDLAAFLSFLDDVASRNATEYTDTLIAILQEDRRDIVREAIIGTLKNLRDPSMPEKVVALFCSPDLALRNAAVTILASQWQAPLDALTQSLKSPNKHIRKLALDALYALGNPILVDIIASVLEDEDVNNVIAAVEYIAGLGGRKYAGQILEVLQKARDPFLIATCLEALGKLGDPRAAKAMQELFPDPAELPEFLLPPYLRFVAGCGSREDLARVCHLAARWGQVFYKEVLDALSALLARNGALDPSEQEMVGDCLRGLLKTPIPSPNKYEILLLLAQVDQEGVVCEARMFLQSNDPLLRIAALEVIAEAGIIGCLGDVERLLATETDEDVRQCAQDTLERLGGAG
jgi:hypothetical protein